MKSNFSLLEPLLPQVVASEVVGEAARTLGVEFPDADRLTAYLANYAVEVAAANARFRRILKSAKGRDFLYAFMRHWLAAELRRTQPVLSRRLPVAFAMGCQPETHEPTATDAQIDREVYALYGLSDEEIKRVEG